jgi:hypothetical protein
MEYGPGKGSARNHGPVRGGHRINILHLWSLIGYIDGLFASVTIFAAYTINQKPCGAMVSTGKFFYIYFIYILF